MAPSGLIVSQGRGQLSQLYYHQLKCQINAVPWNIAVPPNGSRKCLSPASLAGKEYDMEPEKVK
jgi:hypothetical protein